MDLIINIIISIKHIVMLIVHVVADFFNFFIDGLLGNSAVWHTVGSMDKVTKVIIFVLIVFSIYAWTTGLRKLYVLRREHRLW